MEFRAQYQMWTDGIAVMVGERNQSTGKIGWYAKPVKWEMEKLEPNGYVREPTLHLTDQDALNLMNALWGAGVRPSDFKSPNGEINRLEAHLQDMRKLVFSPSAAGESSK